MINFPTRIPDCDSQSPALLDLFLSSYASISSAMVFPSLGNSDHVAVSVYFDFPSYSQQNTSLHCIALWLFLYWLGRSLWSFERCSMGGYLKISASAAAREFFERVQVAVDVYLSHRMYQVKVHSSPWSSAACAAVIAHRNHFFRLYQKDRSSEYKVNYRQAYNRCKRVLEAATLAHFNITTESITSQKIGSHGFWWIDNSVPNKVRSAITPLFNGLEVLSSFLIEQNSLL